MFVVNPKLRFCLLAAGAFALGAAGATARPVDYTNYRARFVLDEPSWTPHTRSVKDSSPEKNSCGKKFRYDSMAVGRTRVASRNAKDGGEAPAPKGAGVFFGGEDSVEVMGDCYKALSIQSYKEGCTVGGWVALAPEARGHLNVMMYKGRLTADPDTTYLFNDCERPEWKLELQSDMVDFTFWQKNGSTAFSNEIFLREFWHGDTFDARRPEDTTGGGWHFVAVSMLPLPAPSAAKDVTIKFQYYFVRAPKDELPSEYFTHRTLSAPADTALLVSEASQSPLHLGRSHGIGAEREMGLVGKMRGLFVYQGVMTLEQLRAEAKSTFPLGDAPEFVRQDQAGKN